MRASWLALAALMSIGFTSSMSLADGQRSLMEAQRSLMEAQRSLTKAQATKADDKKPSDKEDKAVKPKFSAEVLVLHATNSGKGIDKRIGEMPQLGKPPFSSYDSYELLVKKVQPLVKGSPETLELPNKRVLRTELVEVLPKDYLKLSASINQPGGKDFLPLLEVKAKAGQSFMVAGQSYKGGILVLVIRVLANAEK